MYLTVEEMAKLYHVCEDTIRIWAITGKVNGKKFGKRWYFIKKEHIPEEGKKYEDE